MIYYAVFALTTTIMYMYKLHFPIQKELKKLDTNNITLKYPLLSVSVSCMSALVVAPIIFFIVINPNLINSFKEGYIKGVMKDNIDKES